MIYVVNDLHGNSSLAAAVVKSIVEMSSGDTLIINGDGAGSRGPRMNELIRVFYEVRRGETDKTKLISVLTEIIGIKPEIPDSWIYESVHAGLFRAIISEKYDSFKRVVKGETLTALKETIEPISHIASKRGVKVLYSSGNGEIFPTDFLTEDITIEKTLPPEQRFYQQLARNGYFQDLGIDYILYGTTSLEDGIGILGTDILDLDWKTCQKKLNDCGLLGHTIKTLVVHYPPVISLLEKAFPFWMPNMVDKARIKALSRIIEELQISYGTIVFGHIHLGPDDPRMAAYQGTMMFKLDNNNYGLWVKPGFVARVNSFYSCP